LGSNRCRHDIVTDQVRNIIRDINPIPAKGIVEIQAEPTAWGEWEQLLRVRDIAQARLREDSRYLKRAGLIYYQVCRARFTLRCSVITGAERQPYVRESVRIGHG